MLSEEIMGEYQESIQLPNFILEKVPKIRVRSLRLENFKAFDDYEFNFTNNDEIQDFICFIGPNGLGKSTILSALMLLFTRFEGRNKNSVSQMLGKAVRHIDATSNGIYGEEDFLITAVMETSVGNYEVKINKNGFVGDHPEEIKLIVYRLCYLARFDQELNRFQLQRNKWEQFSRLFKSVTGYDIEEYSSPFAFSEDPEQAALLDKYVLDFVIHKPHEIIHHNEASDGEKKVIKSFSTLLNMEFTPQIILVDNIEMHVEVGRHISLITAMRECFPESQLFTTTHSYYISRIFGKRVNVTDLRTIRAPKIIQAESWRFWVIDELSEALMKLESIGCNGDVVEDGKKLLDLSYSEIKDLRQFEWSVKSFLKEVYEKITSDMIPLVQ